MQTATNLIANAQIFARWEGDFERREYAKLCKDYYKGLCYEYLQKVILDTYQSKETRVEALKYIDPLFISSWLIDDLFKTFDAGLKIDFYESDTAKEEFQKILKDIDFVAVLSQVDKFVGVNRDCHVSPIILDNKKIKLDVITSEKASVEQNKDYPLELDGFYFFAQNDVDSPNKNQTNFNKVFMYDKTGQLFELEMKQITDGDKFLSVPDKSQMRLVENQPAYNQIPVVCFSDYVKDDSYWFEGKNKIIQSAFEFDKMNCELRYAVAQQIPIKVAKGVPDNTNIIAGHSAVTVLPNELGGNEGSLEFISPDNKIDILRKNIQERVYDLALSLGFTKDQITGVSASSGYQLMLSKQEIINKNIKRRNYYEKSIKKLVQLITIASAKAGYNIRPIKDDELDKINIEWGSYSYVKSEEEKQKELTMQLANKTTSLIHFFMKEFNLTEEKAIERLNDIMKFNKIANPQTDLTVNQLKLSNQ